MIRRATIEDAPRVVELGESFHASSMWSDIPYDKDAMLIFAQNIIERGAVFLSDNGMICGILSPLLFNPSVVVAAAMAWWSPNAGEGQELRDALENWAKEEGASFHQFSAPHDHRVDGMDRMYKRLGFEPVEIGYRKAVT